MLEEIEKRFPSKVVEEEPKPEKKAKKEEKVEIPTLDAVVKEEITIDEFSRMQLQMGEIISCEEVAKSKKLLCSQVKVQGRTLQIVSGIKHYYTPEQMVGKKVVVITNLKPTKLAGVLSEVCFFVQRISMEIWHCLPQRGYAGWSNDQLGIIK